MLFVLKVPGIDVSNPTVLAMVLKHLQHPTPVANQPALRYRPCQVGMNSIYCANIIRQFH